MSEQPGLSPSRCIDQINEFKEELKGTGFIAGMREAFQSARSTGEAWSSRIQFRS
jgi:hypothetical protein